MELTEGIILKTIKYQENSKIIYVLTKDGLVTALVRASLDYKSKNFSYSQELTKIGFAISKSKKNSFDILTTGMVIDSYLNLKKDYDILLKTSKLMELIYKVANFATNYDKLYQLFSFIIDTLNEKYDKDDHSLNFYPLILKLKLLKLLGLAPTLTNCVSCKNENVVGFSVERGGAVCKKCITENDYKFDSIKIMQVLYLVKLDKLRDEIIGILPIESFQVINEVVDKYYEKYLSIKL